jgi:hypothetical protein
MLKFGRMKKKPWCTRADSQRDRLVISKYVQFMYMSLALRKSAATLALIYGVLILSMGAYEEVSSWGDFRESISSGIGPLCISISLWLISASLVELCKRRRMRLVLLARCQTCPMCFYDLSKRPRDDDVCPECGVIAPRRECVRLWCKLLRSRF